MLNLREAILTDLAHLENYWLNANPEALQAMGADPDKLPPRSAFLEMLESQIRLPIEEKRSYILVMCIDDEPVGHCNTNEISFGVQAKMHLHLWKAPRRQKGTGTEMVRRALPMFFNNLQLKKLICEPYAENPAPNRTLAKVGFEFERKYKTVPGSINFEQEVNRWVMTSARFRELSQ